MTAGRSPKLHIDTFGCQMNDLDSAKMARLLGDAGYVRAGEPAEADVILINTCSVREKPAHKVRSLLGRYKLIKRARPEVLIGLAGCYAQQEQGRLLERHPYLDLVFGPDALGRVVDLLGQARERRVLDTRFHERQDYPFVNDLAERREGTVTAFVTIMKGCDNVCAFCIVPQTRGREVSRARHEVVREVDRLVQDGVREVTLLGQNVNSYRCPVTGTDFPDLVRAVAGVHGLARIRFTTSNPWDFSPELVRAFADVDALMPYLHLPVQTGSDDLLARMRRRHTRADYLDLVGRLRRARPDLALSTDLIAGHPGESDADHRLTLSLVEEVGYDFLYSFKYSPRPHTASARWPDDVPMAEKERRLAEIQATQAPITAARLERLVGTAQPVLVEGRSRNDGAWQTGRTPCNKIVNFPAPARTAGQVLSVRVREAFPHSLGGAVLIRGDEDDAAAFAGADDDAGEASPDLEPLADGATATVVGVELVALGGLPGGPRPVPPGPRRPSA